VDAADAAGLCGWMSWILGCLPAEVRPDELVMALSRRSTRIAGEWRLRRLLSPAFSSGHVASQLYRLPVENAILFALGTIVPSRPFIRSKFPEETHPYLHWWRTSLDGLRSER